MDGGSDFPASECHKHANDTDSGVCDSETINVEVDGVLKAESQNCEKKTLDEKLGTDSGALNGEVNGITNDNSQVKSSQDNSEVNGSVENGAAEDKTGPGHECIVPIEGSGDLGVSNVPLNKHWSGTSLKSGRELGVHSVPLNKQGSRASLGVPGGSDVNVPPPSPGSEGADDVPEYLPQFRSRRGMEVGSENLITNDDLRLAATLVADAMEGHDFELKREPRFVRSYNQFKSVKLRAPLYLAIMVSLSLTLFEEPALPELALPYWATMTVEVICLAFFIFRIAHHGHWRLPKGFQRDVKNITAIVCIVVTIADMVTYVVTKNWFQHLPSVRYSRALRALLIMTFSDGTHLRRAWSNIRMTLKQIIHVIALFYFLIVVFSLVSMKMFQYRDDMQFPDGSPYFKNYMECFWQLYVLVTTANNPDVMMPAYDKTRWYSIFFTMFIVLCLYLMLNILLAVTYNSYRENMKIQIKHSALQKTKTLHQAFEVIKINVDGKEMVTYKTWLRLIKLAHPGKTKHQIDLLMMVLDTDKTGYISRQQFLSVADLLNVPVSEVSERKTLLEIKCPGIYLSHTSKLLHKVVLSACFSLFYDLVVIVNVILICMDVNAAEWYFFALYMLEILLKWYTVGTQKYFHNFQNWTDVFITLMSLGVLIATDVVNTDSGKGNSDTLSVLNVFRIFRILRMLVEFERFKIIFDAVFNVSFSIFTYCGILFIVFYAFAIIGMEIFGGKVRYIGYNGTSPSLAQLTCNHSALENSVFAANRYCNINFNDVINAFVVLASLLIVNNWHIICEGFVLVTTKGARVYFMMFHLCVAVVVMNIVTAFILDMFMHEYTFSKKGNIDTKVELTIKNLQIGIEDETGMEIEEGKTAPAPQRQPSGRDRLKNGRGRRNGRAPSRSMMFRRLTVRNRTHVAKPNLTRYDGIRFHIKKRGWTKTELLLQQLFELESDQEKHMHNEDIRLNTGWTKTELLLQQLFELEDEQEKHMHNEDIRLNTGS